MHESIDLVKVMNDIVCEMHNRNKNTRVNVTLEKAFTSSDDPWDTLYNLLLKGYRAKEETTMSGYANAVLTMIERPEISL